MLGGVGADPDRHDVRNDTGSVGVAVTLLPQDIWNGGLFRQNLNEMPAFHSSKQVTKAHGRIACFLQ